MILIIDNYDSFTYNLYQIVGALNQDVRLVRNDELAVEQIQVMKPDRIIISPGPGRPENAGVITDCIKAMQDSAPILGVCLGHQAICTAFGGKITYAKRLMHGKQSLVKLDLDCALFKGCDEYIQAARYHSLTAEPGDLPNSLKVTATSDDGEIMAVSHVSKPIFGLQFHPESIMTDCGPQIIENFLKV